MKTLYTLAYPVLSSADRQRIEAFRREHDPHFSAIGAHFTMVFGCNAVAEDTYKAHVEAISRCAQPIRFSCRYVMQSADDEEERVHLFLVPDEGYSLLSRLHDDLYRGPLAACLRLDIPFVPHITIASFSDRLAAKRMCDTLNAQGVAIDGIVDALTVATMEEQKVRKLQTFHLAG